jgi:signal transduction histidine kinase
MVVFRQFILKSFTVLKDYFVNSYNATDYPETLFQEANEQCRIFFVPYSVVLFGVWFPYLRIDAALFPEEPLMLPLRLGLTGMTIMGWIARYIWKHPFRHYFIVNSVMSYLIIATAAITGLSKGHPSYIGGYCFVIVVHSVMPLRLRHIFMGLGISLAVFFAISLHFDVTFTDFSLQYSLQDLIGAVIMNIALSIGLLILRGNSFQKGRSLQESNEHIRRQQEGLVEKNHELELTKSLLEEANTEIVKANQELQKSNQLLHSLNLEKNELMGIVSHDLKNPIGAVRGYAQLIENQTFKGDEVLSASSQIVQVSDQMLELVKNLLDMNQLESGIFQLTTVSFDIASLVEATVNQYRVPAKAKNITLHFSNEADDGKGTVSADEQALMQVLDNIVSNAVKYSPHGKHVFVRVKANAATVRVEVQDEGQGISPKDMKKLFGKFARLSARPTGGEHSTGLGLSIVKKMVEAMNGRVWCESELGKGATFIVELPRG